MTYSILSTRKFCTSKDGSTFSLVRGRNGHNYVPLDSIEAVFHCTDGNEKTGKKVGNYNLSIELTCDHTCECYKKGLCYAEGGCYNFPENQRKYTENLKFFLTHTSEEVAAHIIAYIQENKFKLFRYFTCGDIPNLRFFEIMVMVAKALPNVKFWSYTKKYKVVNKYCDLNGKEAIPENLRIIFSHWLNEDGTYFPMPNPYDFPRSEFIPKGKEELAETVTHICPCSDPNVLATCATCDHPCYDLKTGESMALLEHSTTRTKERDKAIKAAKKALKK